MTFRTGNKLKALTYRYLTKNMLLFITPLCIPILILGIFSITTTKSYNEHEIDKNNMTILFQTQQNVEMTFNEMDSLSLMFSTNPEISVSLKETLKKSTTSYEDLEFLKIIRSFIETPAYAKPYIQSIYVYFENERHQFIATTKSGFAELDSFIDTSWYQSFLSHYENAWTELRQVKNFEFETKPTSILTLYRNLAPVNTTHKVGVIVLNINLSYFEKLLNELPTSPQQAIMIVDDHGKIVLRNKISYALSVEDIQKFIGASNDSFFRVKTAEDTYMISQLKSDRYHWRYISVIPQRILYKGPNDIQKLTILILILSFTLGLIVTFYLNKKNDRRIQDIIAIINSANDNTPLPVLRSTTIKDEFGFIINNILQKFIEQKYLKLQLHERQYKQQVAELLALQSQINPHFLFNTLQTIYWKVLQFTGKPNEANEMLENLSDVLKYSLEDPYTPATIGDEINYAKSYIDIQKVRYKDKFNVFWEYDEGIEARQVMRLLLQPLLENAIYHGIKEKAGKSSIKVKIHDRSPELKISVIDSGLGIPAHRLRQIRDDLKHREELSSHIGLMNTNKRLKLMYGEQYGMKVFSKQGIGTVIQIHIPIEKSSLI
ncbi:sensor histidine kinase [Paenibacillus cremeus]|uniref:Sensor histidine kinase n=1 Tax=Paenibacillus cremeus TaxID=2163881 RepID=A0A559K788_9BACL|nr:sensor histidine kinase [Paenibacillus cremeus]TVY08000.1 sensor histidine kinase [Paenibacillus cremeus]